MASQRIGGVLKNALILLGGVFVVVACSPKDRTSEPTEAGAGTGNGGSGASGGSVTGGAPSGGTANGGGGVPSGGGAGGPPGGGRGATGRVAGGTDATPPFAAVGDHSPRGYWR